MRISARGILFFLFVFLFSATSSTLNAQSNSGVITGVVTDPAGAVIPGATVSVQNPVSGYLRTATTDGQGRFRFTNLPLNGYHLIAEAAGFGSITQDASITSAIPLEMKMALKVAGTSTTVTVEADDLLQKDASFRTPVDRGLTALRRGQGPACGL